jgi:hypothetical protein
LTPVATEEKSFLPTPEQLKEEKKSDAVPTSEPKEEAGGAKGLKTLLLKEAVEEKEARFLFMLLAVFCRIGSE